jgi:hypothetical protein
MQQNIDIKKDNHENTSINRSNVIQYDDTFVNLMTRHKRVLPNRFPRENSCENVLFEMAVILLALKSLLKSKKIKIIKIII